MNPAVYTRPAKPMRLEVRRRRDFAPIEKREAPPVVAVDKATECHVTPQDVARRMVEYLGELGTGRTLEPSAGTGALSRALIEAGQPRETLLQVERHHALAALLDPYGEVMQRCFLEYAEETSDRFARVVMNPPFRPVRQHIAAARRLLEPGGCLVALVPVTFETEGAETLETLGPDTFAAAKVHTKIIYEEA